MAELIYVEATEPHTGQVILQEFNDDHPDGVAFLARREGTFQVSRTADVTRAIERGYLVRVENDPPFVAVDEDPEPEDEDGENEDTEPLTPAQKAAQTRKQNAAKGK